MLKILLAAIGCFVLFLCGVKTGRWQLATEMRREIDRGEAFNRLNIGGNDPAPTPKPAAQLALLRHTVLPLERTVVGVVTNFSEVFCERAQIDFNLYNGAGQLVGNADDSVRNLAAHRAWHFKAFYWTDNGAREARLVGLKAE